MAGDEPSGRFAGVSWSKGADGLVLGLVLVVLAKLNLLALLGVGAPPAAGDAIAFDGTVSIASGSPLRLLLGLFSLPLLVFGAPPYVLDAAVVWLGGWIALLTPGWFWIARPALARVRGGPRR